MENKMITLPDGYMAITVDEYSEMLADSNLLMMVINCLMNGSSLSYNGEYLIFDDSAIRALLKASPYAHRYRLRLGELQEEKEDMLNGTGTDCD
jgi:hypothetical protein